MAASTRVDGGCAVYLVIEPGPTAGPRLEAVLAAQPIASVLIVPANGQQLSATLVKPLIDLIQARDTAALLADDAALARTVRADGVHLSAGPDVMDRYTQAREIVGGRAIIGADATGSRHAAMALGEAGVDYIAFGPSDAHVPDDGAVEGPATQAELIAWWSEIFEVPCVATQVDDTDLAQMFAGLGADFVMVRMMVGQTTAASVDYVSTMRDAVRNVG